MTDIAELIRRLEVMERDGSAAAIARLETRVSAVEDKLNGHSTALGKIIMIVEETRERVSKIEIRLDRLEADIKGLRRDLPGIIADTMRDVLKEPR